MTDSELSTLQQETLTAIGRQGEPVVFSPEFLAELRHDADAGLAELTERLVESAAGEPGAEPARLWVSKFAVTQVLSCELAWSQPEPFVWSALTARGTICHRAVQLSLNWNGPVTPADLVDGAMELIAGDDNSLGPWLRAISDVDRADVRALCVERVSAFAEAFPPLKAAWRPVTEARASYPPSGPIVLSARPDLTIGHADGAESRKVIIDLKSGRLRAAHRDDLRYYALVETLVRRIPPRLLVTFSLESAAPDTEAVSEMGLRSALRRTLDAVERMIEVRHEGREAKACGQPFCARCGADADDEAAVEAAVDDASVRW